MSNRSTPLWGGFPEPRGASWRLKSLWSAASGPREYLRSGLWRVRAVLEDRPTTVRLAAATEEL